MSPLTTPVTPSTPAPTASDTEHDPQHHPGADDEHDARARRRPCRPAANAQTPTDGASLPSLDPATAELAPQTANYLKFRATVPDPLSEWNW